MDLFKLDSEEFAGKVQGIVKHSTDFHADWRKEAEEDFNFVAGNQWDEDDVTKLTTEERPIITFNRCNAIISAILGMEANQRQETKFSPRERSDALLADAITNVSKWVRDYAEVEQEEATIFEHALTCGMGWTETTIDYESDLDGKITQESVYPLEMRWDASARKRNLTDRRWQARIKKMPVDEIVERWPDAEMNFGSENSTVLDDAVSTLEYNDPADRYKSGTSGVSNDSGTTIKPSVIQIQWYETVPVFRTVNNMTGQVVKLSEEQHKKIAPVIKERGANIQFVKQRERKYYQAFVCGNTTLEKKDLPVQSGFTFKCVTGKRDHVSKSFYGIMRLMKDPQRWANKFFSQFLEIVASNAKGGLIAETGAVQDVRKFEEEWARADTVTWVTPGSIAQNKIMPRPVAQYPMAVDKLMQFAISSIYETTGVNLEMLGMVDREQAGVVEESRKRSGYTILAPFFDALRVYRRESGLVMLEFIKNYLPAQRIAEVLEEQLRPMAAQIKQIDLRSVNVIVSESPQSENNKVFMWQFISQLLPTLLKLGYPVPPSILTYSPLPPALAEEWGRMMQQQQQANAPKQQMQEKIQQQAQTAEIQKDTASAHKSEAGATREMAEAQLIRAQTITGSFLQRPNSQ